MDQVKARIFSRTGTEIDEKICLIVRAETRKKIRGGRRCGDRSHAGDTEHAGTILRKIGLVRACGTVPSE